MLPSDSSPDEFDGELDEKIFSELCLDSPFCSSYHLPNDDMSFLCVGLIVVNSNAAGMYLNE